MDHGVEWRRLWGFDVDRLEAYDCIWMDMAISHLIEKRP
jgi:hypothetical protein